MPKPKHQLPLAFSPADQSHVLDLYQSMRNSRAKLVRPDGKAQSLPASLPRFLASLTADLNRGRSVAILQNDAQLTTVQAARALGVSRQFLINVLNSGGIPHHMVGTHRRIYAQDLLAYKAKRDSQRRKILDGLSRAEAEEGLYDLEPILDRAR